MGITIVAAIIFIWIGFVCAISFMEAWLKFRAPGVTLPIGLEIGRLVFRALNRMEWVFATGIIAILMITKIELSWIIWLLLLLLLIMVLQTFWFLPKLDKKAEAIVTGKIQKGQAADKKPRKHHFFLAAESFKVILLFVIGFSV